MDRINPFMTLKMAYGNSREFGIATPFALAGNHKIEIELVNQSHAVRSRRIIDTSKDFIEQHQPRRMGIAALAIKAGNRSKQWHGKS